MFATRTTLTQTLLIKFSTVKKFFSNLVDLMHQHYYRKVTVISLLFEAFTGPTNNCSND